VIKSKLVFFARNVEIFTPLCFSYVCCSLSTVRDARALWTIESSALQRVAVCCSVLQYVAVQCSVLQCVTVCRITSLLSVCTYRGVGCKNCKTLQDTATATRCNMLQHAAICCNTHMAYLSSSTAPLQRACSRDDSWDTVILSSCSPCRIPCIRQ